MSLKAFRDRSSILLPLLLALLAAAGLPALQGCRRVSAGRLGAAPVTVFFPPPPERARVQYLGSVSSKKDLPTRRGSFADLVLGPEPDRYSLLKPNNALLIQDRLYVSDTVRNTILVFNLTTGEVRPFAGDAGNGKIKQPNNFTCDAQGNFYVADKIRQAVLIYGPDEQFQRALGRPGQTEPVDVAIGPQGLYVLDIKNHRIEIWDPQSGALVKTLGARGTEPGQFYMPTHLTLDGAGNLYVTDTGNFRIQKLSPDGRPLLAFGGQGDRLGKFSWPKGLGVDGHGNIYVVDSRFYNVQIFDPQGRLLLFFGGPQRDAGCLDLPSGISIQPWPAAVGWLAGKVAGGFDPEFLVTVVSQEGDGLINFFAMAREKSGTP